MTTVPLVKDHALAIIDSLTLLPNVSVGDGEARDTAGAALVVPYAVFYDLNEDYDGTLADPEADLVYRFQVTCVGASAEEARWLVDKVRTHLRSSVAVPGRSTMWLRSSGSTTVRPDTTVKPQVFYGTPAFELRTTPT